MEQSRNENGAFRTAGGGEAVILRMEKLCKSYDGKPVLKDFTEELREGECCVLTGPSGSGKTTLLRLILGLEEADAGQIRSPRPLKTSVVFQEDRLFESFNAAENCGAVLGKEPDMPGDREIREALSEIRMEKQRFNAAEKLIHTTARNKAKYSFDAAFPKMPSYLRRAVLQHVLGEVSSARTRSDNGCPLRNHYMPVFYKDNMYRKEEDRVFLKLYDGKDWVWQEVRLKKTDLDYIRKYWSGVKAKSPVLIKKHRKYFLQFAFEQEAKLTEKSAGAQRICAVDLGINTDAVCSIMEADGTVAARKFINFAAEKDHLQHVLNRVRKHQRLHGPQSAAE